MADHVLQQIREAMFTRLDTGAGVGTAYKGRRTPIKKAALPAANIARIEEDLTHDTIVEPNWATRRGRIEVEILVEDADDCEPILFAQQKAIEQAVDTDPTFGGLTHYMNLLSSRQEESEKMDTEYQIEKRILIFEFQTMTSAGDPTAVIQ